MSDGGAVADRAARLVRFRDGYAAVEAALAGASDEDLDRRPADGGWTAREVAHHLADIEAHGYIRLRRLIAEDGPVLEGHDEPAYVRRLHYDRPIGSSLAVLKAIRDASLELLEALTPGEWERSGTHPKIGPYDVDRWLRIYAEHSHAHAAQITTAIEGSPGSD